MKDCQKKKKRKKKKKKKGDCVSTHSAYVVAAERF